MTTINELEGSLQKLLSTLKNNRNHVPLDVLKTYYKKPYEQLVAQVNETASSFAKAILTDHLILNPNADIDEQIAVINKTIADSGMPKQMGSCMSKNYDVGQLHQLALELRKKVEAALWPYIDQETCLVADLMDIETEPVIYNTLLKKCYINDQWVQQDIDLQGKLRIYLNPNKKFNIKNEQENEPCI